MIVALGAQNAKVIGLSKKKSYSVNTTTKAKLDKLSYDELRAVVDIQKEVIESLKKKKALAKKKY